MNITQPEDFLDFPEQKQNELILALLQEYNYLHVYPLKHSGLPLYTAEYRGSEHHNGLNLENLAAALTLLVARDFLFPVKLLDSSLLTDQSGSWVYFQLATDAVHVSDQEWDQIKLVDIDQEFNVMQN